MRLSITALCYYAKCHYAECHVLFIGMLSGIMMNVVMLSVVAPFLPSSPMLVPGTNALAYLASLSVMKSFFYCQIIVSVDSVSKSVKAFQTWGYKTFTDVIYEFL
jgi:hypothetical protein